MSAPSDLDADPDASQQLLDLYDAALPEMYQHLHSSTSTSTVILPDRKASTMANNPSTDSTGAITSRAQTITPYITVHDGAAAMDWYVAGFGATETVRYVGDDGRLGHAEFVLHGARVMLSDAYPEIGVVAANSYEGSSCALVVEVPSCNAAHDLAVEHGATSTMPPTDQPHGARSATIIDPFGHRWMLSQQLTTPSNEQINERYDDFDVIDTAPD